PDTPDRGLRYHLPGPALPASEGCKHGTMEAWNRAGFKLFAPSFRGVRSTSPESISPRTQPANGFRGSRQVARPGMTEGAVNSVENPNSLRILRSPPYIHGGLANMLESGLTTQGPNHHALYAPIPRRAARPASGFGSRGPAREVEEGGKGVERAVAVPAGEVALVHG